MKEKPPAFQFYPKDFLEGTADMDNAAVGAYIRLLCYQWLKLGITNNNEILIRYCHGEENGISSAKEKFLVDSDGKLRNRKLEKIRKKQDQYLNGKSAAGKKGMANRWGINNKTDNTVITEAITEVITKGITKGITNDNSSTATSSSTAKALQAMREKVFEIMRISTSRSLYSDKLLEQETAAFISKYGQKKIGDLGSLIAGWIKNFKPDTEPKKMVI